MLMYTVGHIQLYHNNAKIDQNKSTITIDVDSNINSYSEIELPPNWKFSFPQQELNPGQNSENYISYSAPDEKCYKKTFFNLVVNKTSTITSKIMLDNVNISMLDSNDIVYDGSYKKPNINVVLNNQQLIKDQDYVIIYENNLNAGQARFKLTGIGEYAGSKELGFTIHKAKNKITNFNLVDNKLKATATFGTVQFKYYTDENCTNEIKRPAFNNNDVYYAKAYVPETENYSEAYSPYVLKLENFVASNLINDSHTGLNNINPINQKELINNDKDQHKENDHNYLNWIIISISVTVVIGVLSATFITLFIRKKKNVSKK